MKKVFLSLFLTIVIFQSSIGQSKQALQWQIGYYKPVNDQPLEWMVSAVPGAIQIAVMK